jgi:hypothetical protein
VRDGHEGSIPFTRSIVYRGCLTFAGFCISFASGRRFPPPEMVQELTQLLLRTLEALVRDHEQQQRQQQQLFFSK